MDRKSRISEMVWDVENLQEEMLRWGRGSLQVERELSPASQDLVAG